ncbi:hypothetical protein DXC92_08670 [Clostridiales bacterium TF09-2AC]|uniref:Aldose 1-epimerase family protein n=1 Tax=Enterocloster hominis (ex Hitch et al. 2024) TaxID=1917870 RepID=A0ABV1D9U0_9FIRM|nr:hypothetical protein DXC92_08670 [Clostridiales bacterium TF09-2AC]
MELERISNQELEVEVNAYGAELWSVKDVRTRRQYLWQGRPDIWELRAPVIFPYCGRIKDFKFYGPDGKEYQGQNHGFARFTTHRLKENTGEGMTWRIEADEQLRRLYPYEFSLETAYRLDGTDLHWTYLVKNNGDRDMPFNVGYHPGFICPFEGGSQDIGDYALIFEREETPIQLISDDQGQLRTGEERIYFTACKEIPLKNGMFPKNVCLTGLKSEYIDITDRSSGRYIRVHIGGFKNLLLWSKPGDIHFICIEPWTGLADDEQSRQRLELKRDIQILKPGESYEKDLLIELGGAR